MSETVLKLKKIVSRVKKKIKPTKKEPIKDKDWSYKNYNYPWNIPLEQRIKIFSKASKKKNIIYIGLIPEPGTFRYRVYNMVQMINAELSDYQAAFFYQNEVEELFRHIDDIDLLIINRCEWTPALEDLISRLHSQNKKVIYDIDDLVFNIDHVTLMFKQISAPEIDRIKWFGKIASSQILIQQCDYTLSTNQYLADKLKESFPDKQSFVIRNFMNFEQIEASEKLNLQKKDNKEKFIIGYFSGTGTHNKDFELIEDQIIEILKKHHNAVLRVVGWLDLSPKFMPFGYQIETLGLHNFIDLQKLIWECDLNVIPLVENEFTNSKSELKLFESGIVRTPSIASPTFTYRNIIKDGINGMIAKPDEWNEKIEKLYQDKKLRENISKNAYKYSIENYSPKTVAKDFVKLVQSVL